MSIKKQNIYKSFLLMWSFCEKLKYSLTTYLSNHVATWPYYMLIYQGRTSENWVFTMSVGQNS